MLLGILQLSFCSRVQSFGLGVEPWLDFARSRRGLGLGFLSGIIFWLLFSSYRLYKKLMLHSSKDEGDRMKARDTERTTGPKSLRTTYRQQDVLAAGVARGVAVFFGSFLESSLQDQ